MMSTISSLISFTGAAVLAFLPILHPATALASNSQPHPMTVIFPSPPPLVRFTGTVGPVDEDAGGLSTLTVLTNNAEWLFTLRDVDTLTYTTNPDWMILNDIFPPTLHFTGSDALLRAVDAAASTGAPISVRGRLYLSNGTFFVTSVTPAEQPT